MDTYCPNISLLLKFFAYLNAILQGSAKRRSSGLVNFVSAVAYHFCLALPAAFTQPGIHLLAKPCTQHGR